MVVIWPVILILLRKISFPRDSHAVPVNLATTPVQISAIELYRYKSWYRDLYRYKSRRFFGPRIIPVEMSVPRIVPVQISVPRILPVEISAPHVYCVPGYMVHFVCALSVVISVIINAGTSPIHDCNGDNNSFNLVYDTTWLIFYKGFKYIETSNISWFFQWF